MSASLLVLPLSASLILRTNCLKVSAVIFIVTNPVVVMAISVAEVPPRHLYDDAASHNTS